MTKNHLRVAQWAASDSETVRYQKLLDVEILPRLERPGRYLGPFEARGVAAKSAQTQRLALLWPSVPESHHTPAGLAPLKLALETRSQLPVELVCVPAPDAVTILSERGLPPFSRPSWIPLPHFQRLILWIEHPGQLPGLLTLLHLSALPLRATERGAEAPEIIASGPAAEAMTGLLAVWCDQVLPWSDPLSLAEWVAETAPDESLHHPGLPSTSSPSLLTAARGHLESAELIGDVAAGEGRVRPRLEGAPPTSLTEQRSAFGGVRVTRIHLAAASEALRQRLDLLDSKSLRDLCTEALAHESGQLEIEFTLGLPGETAGDRAAVPELVKQLTRIAPRGARQIRVYLGARLPGPNGEGMTPQLLEQVLTGIRERLPARKLKMQTVAPSEFRVATALLRARAEHAEFVERVHAEGVWHGDVDASFQLARWDPILHELENSNAVEDTSALAPEGEASPTGLESVSALPPTLDENGHPFLSEVNSKRRSDRWRRWSALVPREHQLRVVYEKRGAIRHLSHREVSDLLIESCRRGGVPLAIAGVVSPRPKLSFGPSLPVGVEGAGEFVDLSLTRKSPGIVSSLNEHLPDGLIVRAARYLPPGAKCAHAPVQRARYFAQFPSHLESALRSGVERFVDAENCWVERRKGTETTRIDIKSQITELSLDSSAEGELRLHFECDLSGEGLKLRPHELVAALLETSVEDVCTLTLRREQLLSRGGEPMGPWRTPMELVELAVRRSRQMVKRYS